MTQQLPQPVPQNVPTPAKSVIPPTAGEVITSMATGNSYTMGEKIGGDFSGSFLPAKISGKTTSRLRF
jgi:hypothetical protein